MLISSQLAAAVNRSTIMFTAGLFGFLHELILGQAERPYLLALCGAMMGLPFVLAADRRFGERGLPQPDDGEDNERWSHLP